MSCNHSELMQNAGCAGCEADLGDRLDAYILTIGTIRKIIDMWRNKATESGDAMVQVFEAIDRLDERTADSSSTDQEKMK